MPRSKNTNLSKALSEFKTGAQTRKRKMSKAEFNANSELYDVLYSAARRVLSRYKPCAFKKGECFTGMQWHCCDGCCHLLKTGCATKSLSCKLYLCEEAKEKFPECAAALDALESIAEKYNFLGFRMNKQDVFSGLNC